MPLCTLPGATQLARTGTLQYSTARVWVKDQMAPFDAA